MERLPSDEKREGPSKKFTKNPIINEKIFMGNDEKHNQVIIKPRNGYQGRGVTQISSLGKDLYEIHAENKKVTLTDREEVYNQLKVQKKSLQNKRYIVQQRVLLATINDCPFDLRVMVQRRKEFSYLGSNRKTCKSGSDKLFHYECSPKCIAGGRSDTKF